MEKNDGSIDTQVNMFFLQSCLCMAWSPTINSRKCADKQQIVAGYSDGTIRLFGILKTEMELKIHPHPVAVSAITYSMDGTIHSV